MNLALAAEKARLLPEKTFTALRALHPILVDLNSLKENRINYCHWAVVLSIFSMLLTTRWEMMLLEPMLEKLNIPKDGWGYIYLILHFGVLLLAGFILGRLLYNKKIKQKINEFHGVYAHHQHAAAETLQYIAEFDQQRFNAARKEIKRLEATYPYHAR